VSVLESNAVEVWIVDDESLARERLHRLVDGLPGYKVAGESGNGLEALEAFNQHRPDVMLLDIRMPGMDGLEAARHLAAMDTPPAVVFTTAFGDHALEAFDARAVDYLLKPIRRERLARALERAERLRPERVRALEAESSARTHLSVPIPGGLEVIPVAEVIYFHADQKYVTVRHAEGEALIEESLKALEEEFGEAFVRIHRSALVARDQLVGIESDGAGHHRAHLRDVDERLEISRRHAPEVRRFLKERLSGR